jgi:hypothetical protein
VIVAPPTGGAGRSTTGRGSAARWIGAQRGRRRRDRFGLVVFGLAVPDTVRQAQAMDLADHGIARHTAQFLGDLAGALAFGPHLFQRLDALIRPGHA